MLAAKKLNHLKMLILISFFFFFLILNTVMSLITQDHVEKMWWKNNYRETCCHLCFGHFHSAQISLKYSLATRVVF